MLLRFLFERFERLGSFMAGALPWEYDSRGFHNFWRMHGERSRHLDSTCATLAALLGDASEHLYQLNHVYVALPTKEASIKTKDDRLFARLDVWDRSKKITLGFSKQGHVAARFTSRWSRQRI